MKKLAVLLLSFNVSANVTIDVGQTSALSSNVGLQSRSGSYLSVINVPTLHDENNRVAKGTQYVDFYLHDNAPMSVKVAGNLINPGETKQLSLTANSAGGLDIPINSNALGVVGDVFFTLTINEVKAVSCPSGWTLANSETYCYKIEYYEPSYWFCEGGIGRDGGTRYSEGSPCYEKVGKIRDPSAVCSSGYTRDKWKRGYCTDSKAYVTNDKQACLDSGGRFSWSGSHNICTYLSPHMYGVPWVCPAGSASYGPYCSNGNIIGTTVARCPNGNNNPYGNCSELVTRAPN